jgi:hypothetical protein
VVKRLNKKVADRVNPPNRREKSYITKPRGEYEE